MAAAEDGELVSVAKASIGPRAEPPGTCAQAAALVAKDARTAMRAPVACVASTLAPALLVFLMGITGLVQDDSPSPAQATSFEAAVRAGCRQGQAFAAVAAPPLPESCAQLVPGARQLPEQGSSR